MQPKYYERMRSQDPLRGRSSRQEPTRKKALPLELLLLLGCVSVQIEASGRHRLNERIGNDFRSHKIFVTGDLDCQQVAGA